MAPVPKNNISFEMEMDFAVVFNHLSRKTGLCRSDESI